MVDQGAGARLGSREVSRKMELPRKTWKDSRILAGKQVWEGIPRAAVVQTKRNKPRQGQNTPLKLRMQCIWEEAHGQWLFIIRVAKGQLGMLWTIPCSPLRDSDSENRKGRAWEPTGTGGSGRHSENQWYKTRVRDMAGEVATRGSRTRASWGCDGTDSVVRLLRS